MLQELRIENFAIIDQLTLSFSNGLNVLSGETGAGKSIIVGALSLLLGGRASPDMIRSSKEEATVEAVFDMEPDSLISHQLEARGIQTDETLLLKRIVSRSTKSRAFINGSLATLQMLNEVGMNLISISGQHENQTLLQVDKHIDLLDEFAGLTSLREQMESQYKEHLDVSRRLLALKVLESKKDERKALLCFQIKEIEDAQLKTDEEQQHREEREVIRHAQRLIELTEPAYNTIYQSQDSATERLREALAKLKGVVAIDASTKPLYEGLETTLYQVEDAAHTLKGYMQRIDFDSGRLDDIEMRLDEISKLKKKYGESIDEVLRYQVRAKNELGQIESNEEEQGKLEKQLQALEAKMMTVAMRLSEKRAQAAQALKAKVEDELRSLGMKKIVFEVTHDQEKEETKDSDRGGVCIDGFKLTEKGLDAIEFLICPNPGEDLRPLAKIASGGELSRIVLALKRIITQKKGRATIVFDEVDSGIGGATAEVVGSKLKAISHQQQILCITHLPQIATFADIHQSIFKKVLKGRTNTFVRTLHSQKEREEEIARMLGGTTITTRTREHAREMLQSAQRKA